MVRGMTIEEFDQRQDDLRDSRVRQESERARALLELLARRPELREICPRAGHQGEHLLWTA